jgi:antitoxin (DNA-binding transcriptional repressor) of toxin-antitoxin stability system
MTTISKSKLKAHMLQIFREIQKSGEELIVTDHGRPVLKIQAIVEKCSVEKVFGALQGQVVYNEDINAPTLEEWSEA